MKTLANMGQIRSKPVRDVRLSSLYAIVGQYLTNIGQYICATGKVLDLEHPTYWEWIMNAVLVFAIRIVCLSKSELVVGLRLQSVETIPLVEF